MMDLQPVYAAVAGEVMKSAGTFVVAGARRLMELVRRRFGADDERLEQRMIERMAADPELFAEMMAAVVDRAEGSEVVLLPPAEFVDHDEVRARVREAGVHLIAGDYGMGKTALVAKVAEDTAAHFPTGQAYVDLDQFRVDGTLRIPEVQATVLRQLGVGEVAQPAADRHEQYLSVLVRSRCVLIVDNVVERTEAHTLAPPLTESLVLVTTRRLTDDLRAWCPSIVLLAGVDDASARALLARFCGPEMLAAEPEATAELLDHCDRAPYYLRLAGAGLARRRDEPGAVAGYLRDFRPLLERTFGDLSDPARAAAALLARHPGPDLTRASARAMLGDLPVSTIDELIDATLVWKLPGGRLRLFRPARDHALGIPVDGDVPVRALTYYLPLTLAADRDPGRLRRFRWAPAGWPLPHIDRIDWLDAEAEVLVALVTVAWERGLDAAVLQLCGVLEVLYNSRGRALLCLDAFGVGVRSAERLGEPAATARLRAMRGRVLTLMHRFDEALREFELAEASLAGSDDAEMRSSLDEFWARWHEEQGRRGEAIDRLAGCVEIDRRIGHRVALGIHLRMLANVLVADGRAPSALPLLDEAAALDPSIRNAARIATVRAKALAAAGRIEEARRAHDLATRLASEAHATRYREELMAVDAEIAIRAGDLGLARQRLRELLERAAVEGHPRYWDYLRQLDGLT